MAHERAGGLPPYLVVVERLKKAIDDGVYPVGVKLPPQRQLTAEQEFAGATVQKALGYLTAKRWIKAVPSIGHFVLPASDRLPDDSPETVAELAEQVAALSKDNAAMKEQLTTIQRQVGELVSIVGKWSSQPGRSSRPTR